MFVLLASPLNAQLFLLWYMTLFRF